MRCLRRLDSTSVSAGRVATSNKLFSEEQAAAPNAKPDEINNRLDINALPFRLFAMGSDTMLATPLANGLNE